MPRNEIWPKIERLPFLSARESGLYGVSELYLP